MTRRPAFTLLAILTLTIGVGANTAVFSLVNGVFLKPVPLVREPEQVVEVNRRAGGDILDVSYPVFRVMRDERGLLRDAAAYTAIPASLVAGDDAPVVRMILTTTGNYLTLLGARPAAGRFFTPDESFHPAAAAAVVISDRLWRERFGGRLDAIGRPLRVNGVPLTVVGVTPPAFRGHAPGIEVDAYVPLGVRAPGLPTPASLDEPRSGTVQIIARLQPGVTRQAAGEALGIAATRYLASVAPAGRPPEPHPVQVDAFSPVPVVIRGGVTAFLTVLLAISGLLLAMTCVNVAGMILSRATERQSEIAVRYVLGASRGRLIRQLMTESVVLSVAGAALGIALAVWLKQAIQVWMLPGIDLLPVPPSVTLDITIANCICFCFNRSI